MSYFFGGTDDHIETNLVAQLQYMQTGANILSLDAQWPWENKGPLFLLGEFYGSPLSQETVDNTNWHHWATF